MIAASFGRRVVPVESRELVIVPEKQEAGLGFDRKAYEATKAQIRAILMTRINPSVAGRVDPLQFRREIDALVSEIATAERIQLNEAEEIQLATELADDMIGLGPLEPYLGDDNITDILVNGPEDIFIERDGKLEKTNAQFRDPQHVVNVAQRIASAVGRRIDEASPMVDARLADGSRVNIVLPPLVLNGAHISIRKFSRHRITLDVMVEQSNVSTSMARFLEVAGRVRANILISGGTGSGKTTLLNAISRSIDGGERIITIEDAVELRLQQPHVVQMETRAANIEGIGEVAQRELLRNALRMRPDRIIIGEVRGAEAFDMLQAMNTGHDGSMSTIHANSPRDALYRLENMVMMANINLPQRSLRAQIASAINLLVHIERMADGVRRVQNIVELVGMEGDVITMRDLYTYEYSGDLRDGFFDGEYVSSRMRPNLLVRAARYSMERELLRALEIGTA